MIDLQKSQNMDHQTLPGHLDSLQDWARDINITGEQENWIK